MTSARVTALLQQLADLSPAELAEVGQHVKMMGGGPIGPISNRPPDTDAEMVADAVAEVLAGLGVERCNRSQLLGCAQYQSMRQKMPELMDYMRRGGSERVVLGAMLRLGIELLYRDLAAQDVPISSRVMLNHVHRLPAIFNRHFPGYAEAGMLHWIIRQESGHVRQKDRSVAARSTAR